MPLPQPDQSLLATPPLIAVLTQARFDTRPNLAGPDAGAALLAALSPAGFHRLAQVQHQQILVGVGPGQPPTTPQLAGWQLATGDDAWRVSVLSDQMSLETSSYVTWSAFADMWSACIAALASVDAPSILTRLGLRYINRVQSPSMPTNEALVEVGAIDRTFLGPAIDSRLSPYVRATEGRVVLDLDDGICCLVQHGVFREDAGAAFTLDIDAYTEVAATFSSDQVARRSQALNRAALQVFQSVVGPGPVREALKPEGA